MSIPECHFHAGISEGDDLFAALATSGLKAARMRIRLRHGTLEPVASMKRERPKRGNRKADNTDARHRDGTTRSSEERSVIDRERRGRVIQFPDNRSIPTDRERSP